MSGEAPEREPTILHVDAGRAVGGAWVAVDKPAGWLVHPAGGSDAPDLVTWASTRVEMGAGSAVAHRLDVETSGVVVMARDAKVRAALGEWFAGRKVRKRYLGLVVGQPPDRGTLDRPLVDRRRGKPLDAVTRFEVVERLGGVTLVALDPETGRKHQLRRHLSDAGWPLVGDRRYGPKRPKRVPAFPGRLWLHAARLQLPGGGPLEAPLPAELSHQLDVLRSGLSAFASKG